jgi:molecular chaperone DnaK (HSP70)
VGVFNDYQFRNGSGVTIGIWINTTFLEQEMPWNSLVNLLEFEKIKLDQEFKILDFDQKIIRWLVMDVLGTEGKKKLFLSQLPIKLNHLYSMSQPICLVLSDEESGIPFSALLTQSNSGFQLYLLPKAR